VLPALPEQSEEMGMADLAATGVQSWESQGVLGTGEAGCELGLWSPLFRPCKWPMAHKMLSPDCMALCTYDALPF
jgi:hypothetical protein